jgi:hypothetical protein
MSYIEELRSEFAREEIFEVPQPFLLSTLVMKGM